MQAYFLLGRHLCLSVKSIHSLSRAGKNLRFFKFLGFQVFQGFNVYAQSHAEHWTQEYHQLKSYTRTLKSYRGAYTQTNCTYFYAERYKPMNSQKFIEFDMKSKKSDLKIKKPKNLTFQFFLGFLKNLKNLGFLKSIF